MPEVYRNIYKVAREARGLTQEAAAEKLGISDSSIRAYETGQRVPPNEASHGGGYPQCLTALGSEEERLRYLRELGFRVRRHFWFETTDDTREEHWAELSGGIVCCLTNGWVCDKAPL